MARNSLDIERKEMDICHPRHDTNNLIAECVKERKIVQIKVDKCLRKSTLETMLSRHHIQPEIPSPIAPKCVVHVLFIRWLDVMLS